MYIYICMYVYIYIYMYAYIYIYICMYTHSMIVVVVIVAAVALRLASAAAGTQRASSGRSRSLPGSVVIIIHTIMCVLMEILLKIHIKYYMSLLWKCDMEILYVTIMPGIAIGCCHYHEYYH